jgi:TM2 domain-containing membrane protein YozV
MAQFCVYCGEQLHEEGAFCNACGKRKVLTPATSAPPTTHRVAGSTAQADQPVPPSIAARTPQSDLKSCATCGTQNPIEYSFCIKCGKPFTQPAVFTASDDPHRSPTFEQPYTHPTIESTPEEPHRAVPMAEQQVNNIDRNSALTQDKSKLTPQQKLYFQQEYDKQIRNPSTALILTLLLGSIGAHRFYLRQWGWGIAYILFAWTFIPIIASFFECFMIRNRVKKYNEQCAREIRTKMGVIFSTPEIAVAVR